MSVSRFLQACRRQSADATPVWFMRQAGRYMAEYRNIRKHHTILEICERPDLTAEVTLQPIRKLGVDAAILFADILLPVRGLGLKLEFTKGEGPAITPPVRTAAAVAKLRHFNPKEELWFVMDAIRIIRRELVREAKIESGPVPLIGFAGAPFTLASYIVEGGPSDHYLLTKSMMHDTPKVWHALMSHLAKTTSDYLNAQIEAGAQAVQLFDSWVGALSAEDYRKYVQPYTKQVIDSIRPPHPNPLPQAGEGARRSPLPAGEGGARVPVIHFGTGTSGFLEEFCDAGGDVISVDWRIPLDKAWKRIGYERAIQGNLDPVLLTSSLKSLRPVVQNIIKKAAGRRGHIFNLGHGILPSTPVDTVKAVVDWVHESTRR